MRGSEEDRGCEGDDRRAEHAGTIRRWLPFRASRSVLHVLEAGSGRRLLGTCFTALDTHALTVSTLLLADPHDDRHAPYLFPPPLHPEFFFLPLASPSRRRSASSFHSG